MSVNNDNNTFEYLFFGLSKEDFFIENKIEEKTQMNLDDIEKNILEKCGSYIDLMSRFLKHFGFYDPVFIGKLSNIFLSDSMDFMVLDDVDICLGKDDFKILASLDKENVCDFFNTQVGFHRRSDQQVIINLKESFHGDLFSHVIDLFVSDLKHCLFDFNIIKYSIYDKKFVRDDVNINRITQFFVEKKFRINSEYVPNNILFENLRQLNLGYCFFGLDVDGVFLKQIEYLDHFFDGNIDNVIENDLRHFRWLMPRQYFHLPMYSKVSSFVQDVKLKNLSKYFNDVNLFVLRCMDNNSNTTVYEIIKGDEFKSFMICNNILVPDCDLINLCKISEKEVFFYLVYRGDGKCCLEIGYYDGLSWKKSFVNIKNEDKIEFMISCNIFYLFINKKLVYENKFNLEKIYLYPYCVSKPKAYSGSFLVKC